MGIQRELTDLLSFLETNRRSGTTTLVNTIAKENDVWVIVPYRDSGIIFGKSSLSIMELHKTVSIEQKPVLFDNYTMLHIVRESLDKITELQESVDSLYGLIEKLTRTNNSLNREIRKLSRKWWQFWKY